MRRELNAFIAKCANEHFDDIVEAIADGHRYAATTIDAADGGVDIITLSACSLPKNCVSAFSTSSCCWGSR